MRRNRGPKSIQTADGQRWESVYDLQQQMTGSPSPLHPSDIRRYYGRGLDPSQIETAIRAAEMGWMRDLTDLEYESIALDPHLLSIVPKRFRALLASKPVVEAASWDGVNPELAKKYAGYVRQQLSWIPNLRQAILQLNWGHCHGRAALEKMWVQRRSGPIEWQINELRWIHPRRLTLGPYRELRVRDDVWQGGNFEARGLAMCEYPGKFLEFTPQLFNDTTEREGFGPRSLYWALFKRFSWRERMVLIEVFGKPWRIVAVEDPKAGISEEALDVAADAMDEMGANSTGQLPRNIKLITEQPDPKAPEAHAMTAREVNDEMSKLVLGQTRTTDAKPGALGSNGDETAQSEQGGVIEGDSMNLSELLTEGISCDFIRLNFGDEHLDHAPTIILPYEAPPSRSTEIERVTKAYSIGIPLKKTEVYSRLGFEEPGPDDEIVQQQQAPAFPGLPGLAGALGAPGQVPSDQAGVDFENMLRVARVLDLANRIWGR